MMPQKICSEITYALSKTNTGVHILSTGNKTYEALDVFSFHLRSWSIHSYREKIYFHWANIFPIKSLQTFVRRSGLLLWDFFGNSFIFYFLEK